MKVSLLIIVTLFTLVTTAKGQHHEKEVFLFSYFKGNGEDGLHLAYSEDGFKWYALKSDSSFLKPAAGKDKLMRDPCIIIGGDGKFHMVWTVSWSEKGIGYASSNDLVNWSEQQYIPVMEHEPATRNTWAPEITFDQRNNRYVIYWASTIPGRFTETESAGDDKYNHRLYYSTTKDFKTFSKTALLYDQGFNVIDATMVPAEDRYIMFLKDETRTPPQKNIRLAFSEKDDITKFGKPSAPITGNYWAEGPTVVKINSEWIVYFDKYTQHKYGAVSSSDLEQWKDISDQIVMPQGMRHGSVLKITETQLRKLQDRSR